MSIRGSQTNGYPRSIVVRHPDFSGEFHVYADASDYQLGAVIMQEGKPLAYYTRKLNKAQTKYPTWGKGTVINR